MARPREHLRKAPIVEAVVDFRVLREPEISPNVFADLGPSIGAKYSQVGSIHSLEARFGIDNGRVLDPAQNKSDLGWKYQAESEICLFRVDGFTFSKVEPYTAWEDVFSEAFRLWNVYVSVAKPKHLSRIAVRFINRMKVTGSRNISDFLSAPPLLLPPIPSTVVDFLTRVHVIDEQRKCAAVIVQALEPQFEANTMSLLLDIDAFHEEPLDPHEPTLPVLFQALRALKNEIFYASITDKAAEMYE